MTTVFISYRRENTAGEARALFNDLVERLGDKSVFMDVDSIALGRDFRSVLQETTASCDLMLVIIGRNWADATDERGRIRLENPSDYVRLEIETALKRNIAVTPVLVQGAQMPAPEVLPTEIRDLAYRNGFELGHSRWESDIREMIRRLGLDAPSVPASQPKGRRRLAWVLIPGVLIAAIGGGLLLFPHRDQMSPIIKEAPDGSVKEAADGYVALGLFDRNTKIYPNFALASGTSDESGVKVDDIMKANLPVALRANLENTQSGNNPSLGEISKGDCVKILERHDNIRGQTWARIKREKCS
jgi:hypothetical protein